MLLLLLSVLGFWWRFYGEILVGQVWLVGIVIYCCCYHEYCGFYLYTKARFSMSLIDFWCMCVCVVCVYECMRVRVLC